MGLFYPEGERTWRMPSPYDRELSRQVNDIVTLFRRDASLATARSMEGLTIGRSILANPSGFADATTQNYVQSLITLLREARVILS